VNDTLPLGHIAGIRVGLNWTVLALAALLLWSFGGSVFPDALSDAGGALVWSLATVATLLVLASILLHEIGHAIQARRDRMEIDGITLWMLGGVARFRGSFPSAGAEFRIAIAGPVVSLALAVVFGLLAAAPGAGDAPASLAFWLAVVNGTLFVFNLLPALPLDGGRMLRSILWAATGDFVKGTRIAAMIARAMAFALIGIGVLLLVLTGDFSGLWLALLGWFLLQASAAEVRTLMPRQLLGDTRVGDLMAPVDVQIAPGLSIAEFLNRTVWGPPGAGYPVVGDGRLLGWADPAKLGDVPRERWAETPITAVMLPADDAPRLRPDDLAADAAGEFSDGAPRLPVVDDGRVVGLLSASAIARAIGRAHAGYGAGDPSVSA
jgi:Zn-dependent protease/CBS domain-containing protein